MASVLLALATVAGVCLILDGKEVGAPATPAAYGTEARIEDFGTTSTGLLTLQVRGARRVHVRRTRVRDNGLLSTLLERVIGHVGGEYLRAPSTRLDDAAWVGWRLAELLPLEPAQRQALLQEDDPHARLDELLKLMP